MATFLDTSADDVPLYTPVLNYEQLKTALETTLSEYNESNAVMDLVLFEQVHTILRLHPVTKSHVFKTPIACCRRSTFPALIAVRDCLPGFHSACINILAILMSRQWSMYAALHASSANLKAMPCSLVWEVLASNRLRGG